MKLVKGSRGSVVLAGAVARRPDRAGHAWVFLQYVLGFQRLGWEVLWLDSIDAPLDRSRVSREVREFERLTEFASLGESAALLVGATESSAPARPPVRGLDRPALLERIRGADLFINVMGYIRDEEILAAAGQKVFLDIDPGFGQMWEDLGLAHMFFGHDAYATVGEQIGAADCPIPTLGLDWIATPPPVVLDRFEPEDEGATETWTSVCSWRGPFEPIDYRDRRYGLRAHEFRRFIDLPRRTGADFRLALAIDASDSADRDRLLSAGWSLIDPREVASDLDDYRRFIRSSAGEIMIAKGLYVDARSGWFSDRSTCYLASGRPVVAQDTGWTDRYPSGEGLLRFRDAEEAADAIAAVSASPRRHRRAARAVAEAYFDSDRVLASLVERATATGRPASASRAAVS